MPKNNEIINLLAVKFVNCLILYYQNTFGFENCQMRDDIRVINCSRNFWLNFRGSWYYTIYILKKKNNYDGCEDEPIQVKRH